MTRLEQLRQLAESQPDDSLCRYSLGLEYINLERWDEAITECAKALELEQGFSAAYFHKARAEIGGGYHDAARATLTVGIEVATTAGDQKTAGEMRELLDSIP